MFIIDYLTLHLIRIREARELYILLCRNLSTFNVLQNVMTLNSEVIVYYHFSIMVSIDLLE